MSQLNQFKRISDLKPAVQLAGADLLIVSQDNALRKATVDLLGRKLASQIQQSNRIVFRVDSGYIQWQYIGDKNWTNLISIAELQSGVTLTRHSTFFEGDGATMVFSPVDGIKTSEAEKCTVVVGGLVQAPFKAYTVSPLNGGTLIFDEAPPDGLDISIDVYQ